MAPLILQEMLIGPNTHHVGIFGCTRSTSLQPEEIIDISQQLTAKTNITLLLVDADLIAGTDHLLFATIHAFTAFFKKTNRASTQEMEILRFAAGQRQISQAITLLGASESTQRFGGVLANSTPATLETTYLKFLKLAHASDDATVLELNTQEKAQAIQAAFKISDDELNAISPSNKPQDLIHSLQKLVYDRCALLAISR